MNIAEQSCQDFIVALGSKQSGPKSGGAIAFCAALGAALGSMVCDYTIDKKEHVDAQKEIEELLGHLTTYQTIFLNLADADAIVHKPLNEAYDLPKSTKKERKYKKEAIGEALEDSSKVSLAIIRHCSKTIDIMERLMEISDVTMINDIGIGIALCKAAAQSASLSVFVNTKSITNKARATRMDDEAERLLRYTSLKADYVWILLLKKCDKVWRRGFF